MTVAVVFFATVLMNSGHAQPVNPNPPPVPGSASNAPASEATVVLEPSQLNTIKIEPVGTHLFPVEKEAMGSIGFDEDPSTVQAESTLRGYPIDSTDPKV